MQPQIKESFYEEYGDLWAQQVKIDLESLRCKEKVDKYVELFPKDIKIESVIDYGCATGEFLNRFTRHFGARGLGIDISNSMLKTAKNLYPCNEYMQGDLLALDVPKVDAISFNEVLEHIQDPAAYLNKAKKIAKYIFIQVPVEKTWLIATANFLHFKKPVSRQYLTDGHLHEWNKEEFLKIVEDCGLQVIGTGAWWNSKEISHHPFIVEKMKQMGWLRYTLFRIQWSIPYPILSFALRQLIGASFAVVCRVRD